MENKGIQQMVHRLREYYGGHPWYGRSVKELLGEVSEDAAYWKLEGGHSPLELLWHMITWKEFVWSRLEPQPGMDLDYFDDYNWRPIDHSDKTLWQEGLRRYDEVHGKMMAVIEKQDDSILPETVPGRSRGYTYEILLEGIAVHDVYHLGQITILNKISAGLLGKK